MPDKSLVPAAQSREILNPATGEVLKLDAPDDVLAKALEEARDLRSRLQTLVNTIGREVHARMDKRATWTVEVGPGLKLTGTSPRPPETYDGARLFELLVKLVDEGKIEEEAAKAALEVETTYTPKIRGINNLRRLGPELSQALDACRIERDPDEYARSRRAPTVKRSHA